MKIKLRSKVRFLASIFDGIGTVVRKDGLATYIDIDSASLAPIVSLIIPPVGEARLPIAAAAVDIFIADIEVGIDTTSTAVSCNLPSVAAWSAAHVNGLDLAIFDYTGSAHTHNITPVLSGGDTFVQGVVPVISSNFGMVRLRPIGLKWYIKGLS